MGVWLNIVEEHLTSSDVCFVLCSVSVVSDVTNLFNSIPHLLQLTGYFDLF